VGIIRLLFRDKSITIEIVPQATKISTKISIEKFIGCHVFSPRHTATHCNTLQHIATHALWKVHRLQHTLYEKLIGCHVFLPEQSSQNRNEWLPRCHVLDEITLEPYHFDCRKPPPWGGSPIWQVPRPRTCTPFEEFESGASRGVLFICDMRRGSISWVYV